MSSCGCCRPLPPASMLSRVPSGRGISPLSLQGKGPKPHHLSGVKHLCVSGKTNGSAGLWNQRELSSKSRARCAVCVCQCDLMQGFSSHVGLIFEQGSRQVWFQNNKAVWVQVCSEIWLVQWKWKRTTGHFPWIQIVSTSSSKTLAPSVICSWQLKIQRNFYCWVVMR